MRKFWLLSLAALAVTANAYAGDPLRPPAYVQQSATPEQAAPQTVQFKLSSILYSPQRRVAVINGQRIHEGEQIAGARLIRIRADQVRLQDDERTLILTLPSATDLKKRIHPDD